MKQTITIPQAEVLLAKYYDGETSAEEERLLHDFLSQEGLPAYFDADKAIFGFFASEKKKLNQEKASISKWSPFPPSDKVQEQDPMPPQKWERTIAPFIRWSAIAAVFLAGIFILNTLVNAQNQNYTYIDGVKYTDIKFVKAQALASISQISSEPNEVETTVRSLNDNDLIKEQLQLFSHLKE
jgi:hypothetical protein